MSPINLYGAALQRYYSFRKNDNQLHTLRADLYAIIEAIHTYTMEKKRTTIEELAFTAAELDAALKQAGFDLALADPEGARDLSYRARYLRLKSTLYPRLHAYLEYYLATRSYSLRINAEGEEDCQAYHLLVKNYKGSLHELLQQYFDSVRRGAPLIIDEGCK